MRSVGSEMHGLLRSRIDTIYPAPHGRRIVVGRVDLQGICCPDPVDRQVVFVHAIAELGKEAVVVDIVAIGLYPKPNVVLQPGLGVKITLPSAAGFVGWRWAFSFLTAGPLFGAYYMVRLRDSDNSFKDPKEFR